MACGCGEAKAETKAEKKEARAKAKDHKEQVVLSPEAMKNAGIKVVTVTSRILPATIRATANIAHNQDRSFHVTPRVRGQGRRSLRVHRQCRERRQPTRSA